MQSEPTTVLMNSFFFETISQEYVRQPINADKIKRILKRRGCVPATSRLLVPINIKNTHWLCADVNLHQNAITTYDSLGLNPEPGRALAVVLGKSLQKVFSVDAGESPKQENGYDCGVFMIANLSLLARDLPLDYSQKHILDFRKATALRILRKNWDLQNPMSPSAASTTPRQQLN